jgi:hypothetical protein
MTLVRESYWPAGVTLTREADTERPVSAPAPAGFVPPSGPPRSHAVRVGSAGCTLTQEVSYEGPVRDVHYSARDLAAEDRARELSQAARDSILRPARFAGTRFDHD